MIVAIGLVSASVAWPGKGNSLPLPDPAPSKPIAAPGTLSVMTFNVKGLPWPVATGRSRDLARIGGDLAALRREGRQPQIVLLQEAFTDDAKQIGAIAGYRHVLFGPDASSPRLPGPGGGESDFAKDGSWLKGEGLGHWVDSGLAILSDYPIAPGRQAIFPNGECAGFDCLASKGIELAWVRIPGQASPLAIVDTHLNSLRSTHVSFARADKAFAMQFTAARRFVEANLPPGTSAIFGGDFNIGREGSRIRYARRTGGPLPGATEALTQALARDLIEQGSLGDAYKSRRKGNDFEFFRSTPSLPLKLARVRVVFGTQGARGNLSDHIGYAAEYRLR